MTDLLIDLAGRRPLVVAIDDVQWCDQPSEAVLAFAARRLRSEPVGFVLARRLSDSETGDVAEGQAAPASSGALVAAVDRRVRLEVGPMSVGALGRLLRERLGAVYPRPLLVRLHAACVGNPFLGLEISRSLLARGVEQAPGKPLPVPAEAGPLVRDHLASLSRDARRTLVIVAMAVEPTLGLIERVLAHQDPKKLVDETIAQFEGILERAPLDTRVATVRDLFERVDVDSRELKAVAVWNMTTDLGMTRSDAVSVWLRR